jgi:hypothetical protein
MSATTDIVFQCKIGISSFFDDLVLGTPVALLMPRLVCSRAGSSIESSNTSVIRFRRLPPVSGGEVFEISTESPNDL